MALELRKRVVDLLSTHPEQRFKARDIAIWICKAYPQEAAAKMSASSFIKNETQLLNQIVAEIGANRPKWQDQHPEMRTTEGRPRLFYWTLKSEQTQVEE